VFSVLSAGVFFVGRVRADLLEFLSGSKVEGQLVARDEKMVTFTTKLGDRTYTRQYPFDRIRAITAGGKREVIHEPGSAGDGTSAAAKSPPGKGSTRASAAASARKERSRAEIEALIDKLGRTPPDWWDSVPLDYPKTLDLSWPHPAPPPWNNQRNVGQYVWDVINHNPAKWREGVRFMHHLLTIHKDHPDTRNRAMRELARMYQDLLEDYARAAFWWRKAGADQPNDYAGAHLAECYWKLGNKRMAVEQLGKAGPTFGMVKLWADMGETQRALQMADSAARGEAADVACIYAGDACRVAGRHQQAVQYYQKVLAMRAEGQVKKRIERNQQRAQANIEAIRLFDTLDLRRVPDGAYQSSGLGYEAPVHVEVAIKGGRIESVRVTSHREKQFYTALTDTPAKIIAKQSVQGVDATSRATITSEAIINATAKALADGMR
jgi:uncharacterized protein with FMN-binding domain